MKSRALWHKKTAAARDDGDLFPTDRPITAAFMNAEAPKLRAMGVDTISEPACGRGDMAEVIKGYGFRVVASDLKHRGYGRGGRDFLKSTKPAARAIVSNPPYMDDLAQAFIVHAKKIGVEYLALLLKAQFWNTRGNALLWKCYRPAREYKIAWRPDFLGLGGGMLDVCFWVWDFRRPAKDTKVFLLTFDGVRL